MSLLRRTLFFFFPGWHIFDANKYHKSEGLLRFEERKCSWQMCYCEVGKGQKGQILAGSNQDHQQFNKDFRHVCQFLLCVRCVFHVLTTICSALCLVKTVLCLCMWSMLPPLHVCFWSRPPLVLCCERLKGGLGSVQALVCVRMSVGSPLTLV